MWEDVKEGVDEGVSIKHVGKNGTGVGERFRGSLDDLGDAGK